MTPTPATGQIWRRESTGRRIELLNVNEFGDWQYKTVTDGAGPRRMGRIYVWNLKRHYTLEEAA